MNRRLALFFVSVCVAIPASAQTKSTQESETDRAQLVATAEIMKLDAKKMILQVREVRESTTNPNGRGGGNGGPRVGNGGGRRGGGGGRRTGGVGFPGGGGGRYPGGGGPGTGGSSGQNQLKEYK